MKAIIENKEYTLLIGYQKENKYRAGFNALVNKIFRISFGEWYQAGFWNEKYIPYTLFDGERAIANVSVNIMDFNILGQQQRFIQIGTVLTDEEYRNQKLSLFLMEKVLDEWNHQCDLIYLYANPSAVGMYPKFDFSRVKEYEYFKSIDKKSDRENFIKLNMDTTADRIMLYDYAKNSAIFSRLTMQENADLVMFYCLSFLKNNIFYIKTLDVVAIATFDNNQLRLWDVFGKNQVELDTVIASLANAQIDQVVLGFTPLDCSSYQSKEISGDDTLFIQNGKTKLFDENKLMFPLLSHA